MCPLCCTLPGPYTYGLCLLFRRFQELMVFTFDEFHQLTKQLNLNLNFFIRKKILHARYSPFPSLRLYLFIFQPKFSFQPYVFDISKFTSLFNSNTKILFLTLKFGFYFYS